jgi:copper transport protein
VARSGLAVALAVLVLASLPAAAGAHASLVGGDPEPGGVARVAPRALTIRFDEAVDAALATLRVEDTRGKRYDIGPVRAAPGHGLRVALERGLPDGQYVVLYRVVSDDGHTIPGGFGFAVGRDAEPPPARVGGAAGGGPTIRTAAWIGAAEATARAVRDGALAVVAGVLAFALLVWWPALPEAATADERWRVAGRAFAVAARRLVVLAAALGALAAVAGIALTGAAARGTGLDAVLDADVLRAVLRTRFGTASALGAGLLALVALGAATAPALGRAVHMVALHTAPPGIVAVPLVRPWPPRPADLSATGLAVGPGRLARRGGGAAAGLLVLALALVPVLAGHATTRAHPVLLTISGTTHVLAASLWIGGIATLLLAVPGATRALVPADRTILLGVLLRRFSLVAGGAVALLALTGVVQALVEVGALHALVDSAFGRATLIKAGLLVSLLGIAAAHRLEHLPRLGALRRRGDAPGAAGVAIRRTLRIEALGLVAVLAATGALAGYAPPGGAPPGPAPLTLRFEQATLRGTLSPARAGDNTLSFVLARTGGDLAFADIERVTVAAAGPGHRTARTVLAGRRDGTYRVPLRLAAHGTWTVTLTLRVDTYNSFTRSARVTVR